MTALKIIFELENKLESKYKSYFWPKISAAELFLSRHNFLARVATWHRDSIGANHPAALGSIFGAPKENYFDAAEIHRQR